MSIQFRIHENGGVCCSSTNARGERVTPMHPCEKCKPHFAALGLRTAEAHKGDEAENYAPKSGYEPHLAVMRAAAATPESRFAERYAAERTRELEETRAALDKEAR